MRLGWTLLLLAAIVTGCAAQRELRPGEAELPAVHAVDRPDWAAAFDAVGAENGAAVVYDEGSRAVFRYDKARCATRTVPASTFKIFNALVALDTGVLTGPEQVIRWDGLKREVAGWNEDLDARTAFRRSAVWYFEALARRVGPERMQAAMRREGYGNAETAGAFPYWIDGELAISPDEQVAFLRRLRRGQTGFSPRAVETVAAMMAVGTVEGYAYHLKTGWARPGGRHVGWWVGWIEEHPQRVWYYAVRLESARPDFDMTGARRRVTNAIFRSLGLPEAP